MHYRIDSTARWSFAAGCAVLVFVRMLNPELVFDWMSLVLVVLAGVAIFLPGEPAPTAAESDRAPRKPKSELTEAELNSLAQSIHSAGLELSEDGGNYALLLRAKPAHTAIPVARTLLEDRLRALTAKAELDVAELTGEELLTALAGAGLTTDEQYNCLVKLMHMLDETAQSSPCELEEKLLVSAVRVLEMLDATLG